MDWELTHVVHVGLMSAGYGPYTREYVGRNEWKEWDYELETLPVGQ